MKNMNIIYNVCLQSHIYIVWHKKALTVENFGRSTHPDILAEKASVDGDNKFLLACT